MLPRLCMEWWCCEGAEPGGGGRGDKVRCPNLWRPCSLTLRARRQLSIKERKSEDYCAQSK